jgi:formylmethanofuran dehydrogenase subunit E
MRKCDRCSEPNPEDELIEVHAWLICDLCFDEL